MPFLLALDQDAIGSRAIVFNENQQTLATAQQKFMQRYPRSSRDENAPHLVSVLPILVPAANRLELVRFWIGLKIYDWLSGQASFGPSRYLSRTQQRARMPAVANAGLPGRLSTLTASLTMPALSSP